MRITTGQFPKDEAKTKMIFRYNFRIYAKKLQNHVTVKYHTHLIHIFLLVPKSPDLSRRQTNQV